MLSRLEQWHATRGLYYRLFNSTAYWERRYAGGNSSGPGSRGLHSEFKADFVNEFVEDHDIRTVLEFGCGDGDQVALAEYPSYVGLDVSESVIERCSERFADDPEMRFRVYDPHEFDDHAALRADLTLALEVLFHLVNDDVFEKTMYDLFTAAERYVIVFSSKYDDPAPEIHVRHRQFTDYVEKEFPMFELVNHVENPFEDRVSDFYVYECR
jgi:SAM-dependent methyltransferase